MLLVRSYPSLMQRFGDKVGELLGGRGESQAWLAQQSGLSPSVISRVLRGSRGPTTEMITSVAGVFGVDPVHLVLGTDAEGKLADSAEWVRRGELADLTGRLANYEACIHDLERQVRDARKAEADEAKRRQDADATLCRTHLELQRAHADLADVRAQRRSVESELRRYRHGLTAAVAKVKELQVQLAAVATEVRANGRTGRLSVLLSGVAAIAGVATVAHFLTADDEATEEENDE
jgi:transcriptional regulator with XRE-family HTH domain